MRLGPATRVAAAATGIIAVVYVLGVIVLNLVVSARLAQQNDNRLADRLAAASHDQDVFSQRPPRTFRGAGEGDADSAPVFFWLLDARHAVTAQSPGAPVLPTRPLGGRQPRDGLAVTVNAGRADPFRLKMTRDGTGWLVAGQSLAGVAHTKRLQGSSPGWQVVSVGRVPARPSKAVPPRAGQTGNTSSTGGCRRGR